MSSRAWPAPTIACGLPHMSGINSRVVIHPEPTDSGVNKLVEELSTQALVEFDSEVRFRALAARGNISDGLDLLDRLDTHFSKS